jgi:stage IV sporulation protein FB
MIISFSMQDGTAEIAQYRKTPIYLHATFFITAAILAWPFLRMLSVRGFALGLLFIAAILASVLLHELAHLEMARRYGVAAQRIDIHMLGGLVQFRHLPHTRWQDFAITLAGPIANLAVGLILLALLVSASIPDSLRFGDEFDAWPPAHGFLQVLLRACAYLNLGLGVVNLIPAFALDGGKLLFLVVEERQGPRIATLLVAALGLVFALISTLVLIGSAISGFPIWAPPGFKINWRALKAARRGLGGWDRYAFEG